MALVYKLANEKIFRNSRVLKFVGENARTATRMTAELKNLVTQHARTEQRKASFALRVIGKWNQLPTGQEKCKQQQGVPQDEEARKSMIPQPRWKADGDTCGSNRCSSQPHRG